MCVCVMCKYVIMRCFNAPQHYIKWPSIFLIFSVHYSFLFCIHLLLSMLSRQFLRTKAIVAPRMVSRTMASKAFVKYNWEDPLNLEKLLTEDEVFVRDAARSYCQERLLPRVIDAYRNESK